MHSIETLHRPVSELMRMVGRDIVMPRFRNLSVEDINEKAKGDFVTIADKESEIRLAEGLSALLPDAAIIGEEACAADPSIIERAGNGLNWIIDPIDGTGNFANGNAPFGIMIALADGAETIAGWMFDPLTGRMCHAFHRGGSYIDDQPIQAQESDADLPIAALAVYFMTEDERADIQRRAYGRFALVDIPRCAAEQYPRLALGTNDVSVFSRTLPWDHAPGVLFLNEAGGQCSRMDGTPYLIGDTQRGLLGASSPRMWELAANILIS